MKQKEFNVAWQIAISNVQLANFDDNIINGYCQDNFQPVEIPIEIIAKLIRWQCFHSFGGKKTTPFDIIELEELRKTLVGYQKIKICLNQN